MQIAVNGSNNQQTSGHMRMSPVSTTIWISDVYESYLYEQIRIVNTISVAKCAAGCIALLVVWLILAECCRIMFFS